MPKQKVYAISGLLFGAVTWGLIWYPLRVLEAAGVSGWLSTFMSYAMALLLGIVLFARELRRFRDAPAILIWLGLSAGWANLAYVIAVIHGEVMRVLLLFYLAPLWTVALARLLLAEQLTPNGYLIMALSLGGAVVILWQPQAGLPLPANGAEWLGLSAGFMFALTNVLTRRALHASVTLKSFSVWLGVSFLALWILIWRPGSLGVLPHISSMDWMWLLLLGAVIFAVTLAMQYGLSHTPANQAVVILLFELVVAAVSSYLLAGEAMTPREWLGGAMIVAASLFSGRVAKIP